MKTNFINLCLAGIISVKSIDDFVAAWHDSPTNLTLYEYLGMTEQEYARFLESSSSIHQILADRRRPTKLLP